MGFYPEQTQAVVLPIHGHLPESEQPRFYARFLTRRKQIELMEKMKAVVQAEVENNHAAAADGLDAVLGEMLIDRGERLPVGFKASQASQFLSTEDCWDLYAAAMQAIALTRDQLKKSVSPSESGEGISVGSAGGEVKVEAVAQA